MTPSFSRNIELSYCIIITIYADELLHLIVDNIRDKECFEIRDLENETKEYLVYSR